MFFPGNTSSLLLLLSLGTSLPVIIGFLTIRPVPHSERPDTSPGGLTWDSEADVHNSTTHLLSHEPTEPRIDERRLGRATRGALGGDEGPYASEESSDARATEIYADVLPAVTVSQSRSHSMELSPARDDRRRSVSSRRTTIRTVPRGSPDPGLVDTHGKRMLAGWEFWLLFTILSLSE